MRATESSSFSECCFIISLCWYFFTTNRSDDLQLIGTVDANEVIVSSRIPGRIQNLTVDEGDTVQAGQLIATIQSDDLAAARNAAEATAASQHYLLQEAKDTERQLGGSTASQVATQRRRCTRRKPRWLRHRRSWNTRRPIPPAPSRSQRRESIAINRAMKQAPLWMRRKPRSTRPGRT